MIGDSIHIIDDIIPIGKQNEIEKMFTESRLPWIFNKDISLTKAEIEKFDIKKFTPGIGTPIKSDDPKYINHSLLNIIKIIPETACHRIGKVCKDIYQARSFIHFPLNPKLRKEFDNIHIDLGIEHLVVLYYVNDTDGDTFIFDKKTNYKDIQSAGVTDGSELAIIKKVSPKKGRVLIFDGNQYHSSSGPTENIRCIINFDISINR